MPGIELGSGEYKAEIQASKSPYPLETRMSGWTVGAARGCLLYTSDAADEDSPV